MYSAKPIADKGRHPRYAIVASYLYSFLRKGHLDRLVGCLANVGPVAVGCFYIK